MELVVTLWKDSPPFPVLEFFQANRTTLAAASIIWCFFIVIAANFSTITSGISWSMLMLCILGGTATGSGSSSGSGSGSGSDSGSAGWKPAKYPCDCHKNESRQKSYSEELDFILFFNFFLGNWKIHRDDENRSTSE
jgi:hypothetical protein